MDRMSNQNFLLNFDVFGHGFFAAIFTKSARFVHIFTFPRTPIDDRRTPIVITPQFCHVLKKNKQ